MDPAYAEDFANREYQVAHQRVPSQAERRLRINQPWSTAKTQIDAEALNGNEQGLYRLLTFMYDYGLGRAFRGVPINVDTEIKPRVAQIVAGQNTPLNHFEQIVASEEGQAWQTTLKSKDVGAAAKLATAKLLAAQSSDLDKQITNL